MKKNLTIILTSLIGIVSTANAQGELFKVMATKGTIVAKKLSSTEWKPLFTGTRLHKEEQIKVSEKGYLGLIHAPTGKTLEVKTPGTFNVSELAQKVTNTKVSFSEKYSKYVYAELTSAEAEDPNANHKKNMKVTGSVDRGLLNSDFIRVFAPGNSDILKSTATIKWMKNAAAESYVVEVINLVDEVIQKNETSDTSLTLDLAKLNYGEFADDKRVIIKVSAKNNNKLISHSKTLALNESKELLAEIANLEAEFSEESALGYLIKASFYEQKNMFLEAASCYEKAIALEPSAEKYKSMLRIFLVKYELPEFYPYYTSN